MTIQYMISKIPTNLEHPTESGKYHLNKSKNNDIINEIEKHTNWAKLKEE